MVVDYDSVFANYVKFPTIAYLLGQEWLDAQRKEDSERMHPLTQILWSAGNIDRAKLDFERVRAENLRQRSEDVGMLEKWLRIIVIPLQYRNIFTLEHLDSSLNKLPKDSLVPAYRKEIRNGEQFWDVYSEIECAAYASKSHNVELKPKVGGRVIDFRMKIDSSEVLVEVRAARHPVTGFGGDKVPHILQEKAHQFDGLRRDDKTPCVLILDASGSAIEPRLQKPSPDSIPPQISGVLIYKMDFGWDGKAHCLEKFLVENKRAKNALGDFDVSFDELLPK